MVAEVALDAWKKSPGHNAVSWIGLLLEQFITEKYLDAQFYHLEAKYYVLPILQLSILFTFTKNIVYV